MAINIYKASIKGGYLYKEMLLAINVVQKILKYKVVWYDNDLNIALDGCLRYACLNDTPP